MGSWKVHSSPPTAGVSEVDDSVPADTLRGHPAVWQSPQGSEKCPMPVKEFRAEVLCGEAAGALLFCASMDSMAQHPRRAFHRQSVLRAAGWGNAEAREKASVHAACPRPRSLEPPAQHGRLRHGEWWRLRTVLPAQNTP